MKAFFVILVWLLLGVGCWYFSTKCCNANENTIISESTLSGTNEYFTAPLQFDKNKVDLRIGENWSTFKDSIVNNLGEDQLLIIRANAFKDEESAENLGLERASGVLKSLGLDENKVVLNSDIVSEDFNSDVSLVHFSIVDKAEETAENKDGADQDDAKNTQTATQKNETRKASSTAEGIASSNQSSSNEASSTNVTSGNNRSNGTASKNNSSTSTTGDRKASESNQGTYYGNKVQQDGSKTLIYFNQNSKSELQDSEVKTYLRGLAGKLRNNLKIVYIIGHTDNQGSEAFNYNLGLRRAELIEGYLVRLGINPKRIRTYSKGESAPLDSNDTEEGRQRNRRIVLSVGN